MPASTQPHQNQLAGSLSPYLLQHAHNPVDWYPWGEEALAKARAEDKPVFLSIGYAACHWCHVMEHESFEDPQVAELLNKHFVSIKVDREERPDLDEIYMQATQALNNGNGGWPMSVFLRPDGVPFYAGTYYRREQFMALVEGLAGVWKNERVNIDEAAGAMREHLQRWASGSEAAAGVPPVELRDQTARTLADSFDLQRGGMRSQRNKFPPSMAMELMLRSHAATSDAGLLKAVEVTLDHMARGGIYDHLGGGICRYSTDSNWLVPHFEKMLYDQALVSSIYLDGYQVFKKQLYADTARGIFDYVTTDLQSLEGGFYSTRDADSEGQEGKYYIWTIEEVREVLGAADAEVFCAHYDVTSGGNWDEPFGHAPPGPKNILNVKREPSEIARQFSLTEAELERRLAAMRTKLLAVRSRRVAPALDDKILTSWNGLMIASLARGGQVLDEPRYIQAAMKAAEFVLRELQKDGRLLRAHRRGESRGAGFLEDYAFLIEGLLNLYEASFETRWLRQAEALADKCHTHFADEAQGGYFQTADDSEVLIARSKNSSDGAIPGGNAVQARNLLRLALLLDRQELRTRAESIFRSAGRQLERSPWSHERLLAALDLYHARPKEIVLAAAQPEELRPLILATHSRYLPNKVVCASLGRPGDEQFPLLRGKAAPAGKPAAFVCENYHCKLPVYSAVELEKLLWPKQSAD